MRKNLATFAGVFEPFDWLLFTPFPCKVLKVGPAGGSDAGLWTETPHLLHWKMLKPEHFCLNKVKYHN